ncbi:hypothetical protein B0J17DRAFT_772983 [Rhizoctonia solani]|nr:hypothetical protein B0J17DRAFT_772983 [Rhizoctonia solani]
MEVRDSNPPNIASDSAFVPFSKDKAPSQTNRWDENATEVRRNSFVEWSSTVWTLVIHCILSVGLTIFMLVYISGRHFNISDRSPLVNIAGGTRDTPFLPAQSDIVTIVSSIIAVLKYTLVAWVATLWWNVALFLIDRRRVAVRDLRTLLRFGQLTPSTYSRDWSTWIIGILFLVSLAANLASPILTGSISWVPSNRLVRGLSTPPFPFGDAVDGTIQQLNPDYFNRDAVREAYVMSSVGVANLGWGRDPEKGVMKRVAHSFGGLSTNSTIEHFTLPYFQVHSIRWIENRAEIPGISGNATPSAILDRQFAGTPSSISSYPVGYAVLIPNITSNWSSDPLESTLVHDTRLLILYYGWDRSSGSHSALTQDLPPNAFKLLSGTGLYAFAWVTFSAGAGRCKDYNCLVTEFSIRNNTPVEIEPHQLTFQALSMATIVGVHMVHQNTSIPYMWGMVNDYVEAVLVRSYSASWSYLDPGMQTSVIRSNYVPSIPSLLAWVDQRRVYAWLALQLLVTVLSVLFIIVHYRLSRYPLLGDTSLTAFYLDTSAVPRDDTDPSINGVKKIEKRDGRLAVKFA